GGGGRRRRAGSRGYGPRGAGPGRGGGITGPAIPSGGGSWGSTSRSPAASGRGASGSRRSWRGPPSPPWRPRPAPLPTVATWSSRRPGREPARRGHREREAEHKRGAADPVARLALVGAVRGGRRDLHPVLAVHLTHAAAARDVPH